LRVTVFRFGPIVAIVVIMQTNNNLSESSIISSYRALNDAGEGYAPAADVTTTWECVAVANAGTDAAIVVYDTPDGLVAVADVNGLWAVTL
jgi:hypothetical protein